MLNKINLILFLKLCIIIHTKVLGQQIDNPSNQNEWTNEQKINEWKVTFDNTTLSIDMSDKIETFLKIENFNIKNSLKNSIIKIYCEDKNICNITNITVIKSNDIDWEGYITVEGILMGRSKVFIEIEFTKINIEKSSMYQEIIVTKKMGTLDLIFTIGIGIMVSVIFVSFGAVLDLTTLKDILLKPIGPVIGFCCQFILMPILSYSLGYLLFSNNVNMWLGLFFTGVTPGGGASNMWTLILKGNVNLSIVMTTISNLAAFAMMPFWIFTLGKTIFDHGDLGVPYEKITTLSVSLLVPLIIGLLLQKFQPKIANILIKLLKPISIIILVFIITFAVITNYFMFKLFSWKIIIAGMGLPWCGYFVSYMLAWILKQNKPDCLTISIETGLQNTGVAIFLLRFSLEQPEADLTSIVPVAVSIMTKVPLLMLYLVQRFLIKNPEVDKNVKTEVVEEEKFVTS